jgi:outer membrane protein TolC
MKFFVRFAITMTVILFSMPLSAQMISLEDAVSLALKYSHDLKIGSMDTDKADYLKKSALSQMGPKFIASGKIVRWDEPTDVAFNLPDQLVQMLGTVPKMHIMDQTTKDLSIQVAQPLTPLYSLYNVYRVQDLNEQASKISIKSKETNVIYSVSQSYFSLLKLLKNREIAQVSISQVESHLNTANAFYKNGFVQKDDVLRAEVALAQVKQVLDNVNMGIELAKAGLNLLMGRSLNQNFEPKDQYPDPPPALSDSLDQYLSEAMKNRSEIKEMELRAEMAEAGKDAVFGQMIPNLSAVFNWSRQWGTEMQRESSYFVGGVLSWNFWEWGTTYYQMQAADLDIRKAREGLMAIKDMVQIDVKSSYLQAKTSCSSLVTNRKAVEQANESFRIVNEKYENKQATSTEVIDAESMLTAAKNNYVNALYTYYLALENLKRAVGK